MKSRSKIIVINFLLIVFLQLGKELKAQDIPQERLTMMQHIVQERPVLVELITIAGLTPVFSNESQYTLFAPPDEMLLTLKEESPERLKAILSAHILKGKYLEKDLKDGAKIETLAGNTVHVCRKKGDTLINGIKITSGNTSVRNGVVHGLNNTITQ